jgi:DNA-binding transcriptional MerR regulator
MPRTVEFDIDVNVNLGGGMKIGDLAARTGVPPRMLRYYEQQGLLHPGRGDNGYRRYSEADVERVHTVRSLIRSGMPTKLIGAVVDMQSEPAWTPTCTAALAEELAAELHSIEDRIACLSLSRDTLRDYLERVGAMSTRGAKSSSN